MSRRMTIFASLVLLAGAVAAAPDPADAQQWSGGMHERAAWGWGPQVYLGWRAPYYAPPYTLAQPRRCRWQMVRVWSRGHWRWSRLWACW
jgi:hypothetical protein